MSTLVNDSALMMHDYEELNPIVDTLKDGGLILYPTDTIWGIGCDATNSASVDKVYDLKQRDKNKPFIILVSSIEMLKDHVAIVHPRIETLLLYHNRPLTIIYDKAKNLPANAIAKGGSVGIRLVQDEFCRQMIEAFGKPIISSSANISNEPFPAHFGEISSAVIQGVDYVAKHRRTDKSQREPSIVARMTDHNSGELEFLRE